jgi:acetyl esterase/lipase
MGPKVSRGNGRVNTHPTIWSYKTTTWSCIIAIGDAVAPQQTKVLLLTLRRRSVTVHVQNTPVLTTAFLLTLLSLGMGVSRAIEQPAGAEIVKLWPGEAPGTPADWTEPEFVGRESITNVTVPTLTVIRPKQDRPNGTAMVVAPGGSFTGLAWNLEGVEIAQWLADRGITAFILKYRVRRGQTLANQAPSAPAVDPMGLFKPGMDLAMADGMQAVRLIRQNAARYGIRPDRIGFIGFSAGAMTAMNVILKGDAACRPDFAAPIYGAMPPVAPPANAPPLFVVVAKDDKVMFERSMEIFNTWAAAGLSAELHVYEKGGHGFGMRKKNLPVDNWPQAFEAWLAEHGLVGKISEAAAR